MSQAPSVAIVGATGAVGQEFLNILEQRRFPIDRLKLLASARSAGKMMTFNGESYTVAELTESSFEDVDLALFSASGSISKRFAPIAVEADCTVVDNSSAFRMDPSWPLVVPEVNPEAMAGIEIGTPGKAGIVANPNCSTIIMLLAVTPIHRAVGVSRIVVSTYQAASGAGYEAMQELEHQTRQVLGGEAPTCEVFPEPYAFNLFSHNSEIGPEGYNTEEMKMVHETHKIWNQTDPAERTAITATCVRVPVMRAHAESINLSLRAPMSEDEARALLSGAAGVTIQDDRPTNRFPTPLLVSGRDDVFVGRIRRDISQPEGQDMGLDLFVCGDQLRKGAALNAVQIAERLLGLEATVGA